MRSCPGREGLVRDVRDHAGGGSVVDVEITSRKLAVKGETGLMAVAPADTRWIGEGVTFVPTSGGRSNGSRPAGGEPAGVAAVGSRPADEREPRP
jgi:hypothetical protein